MIGSRLRERLIQVTLDVLSRNSAGSETTVYDDIIATHSQSITDEILVEFGNVVTQVTDIFKFERLVSTGLLPVILEKHIIRTGGVKYEIIGVVDQGGEGNRLFVVTKRVR